MAGDKAAETVRQKTEQHGRKGSQHQTVEQGMAGGADHVGVGKNDAVGKAEALLLLAGQVAVEPGVECAVGPVAGEAIPFRLVLAENLVREHVLGPDFGGMAFDAADGFPVQAGVGQPAVNLIDLRPLFLVRCEAGEFFVGIVAGEADLVVLGDDASRIALLVGNAHDVRVMAGGAAHGFTQIGVHRFLELFFDQVGFLRVAIGAGAGVVLGVRCVRMLVITFVVALGAELALVIGLLKGLRMLDQHAQLGQIKTFFRELLDTGGRMAGKALGIGLTDFVSLFARCCGVLGLAERRECAKEQSASSNGDQASDLMIHFSLPMPSVVWLLFWHRTALA